MSRLALAALALGLAAGCSPPDEGPWMQPGESCLQCHAQGGSAEGKTWTAAGTVYPSADAGKNDGLSSATVHITDANGKTLSLTSNGAGNFYTAESLPTPWKVAVERNGKRLEMSSSPASGSCNSCHYVGGAAGGPLYAP